MHQLSKSDQGSEDKRLTSLRLNILSQSGLKQSRGCELPICCTVKRTEIPLQAGLWAPAKSNTQYLAFLYCPLLLSSLASKDQHFTQYDCMSALIEMIPFLSRQHFCAQSAMSFIHYRPHSCCLIHASGSHCHHWRAPAKPEACLSEAPSQRWVMHPSFDSQIGGRYICVKESQSQLASNQRSFSSGRNRVFEEPV